MGSTSYRGPLRLLSIVVLLVLVSGGLIASLLTRSVVRDQSDRLLEERTKEASLLVTTLFSSSQMMLPLIAATTDPQPGSTAKFDAIAGALRGPGTIGSLAVADDGAVSTVAVAGDPSSMDSATKDLARRAVTAKGMVTSVAERPTRHLIFAVATSPGRVLVQQFPLGDFANYKSMPGDPFSELDGVVYASDHVDPSKVILSTARHTVLTGDVHRSSVKVGADEWLIVTKANRPLVGGLTASAPWIVLGAILAGAVLSTLLVETLGRRRLYALALVEERTAELRAAVDEQQRLEQGQRQARELAEAANHAKSEFLSRMSHELRTPLNAILGFGQLLELDELTPEQSESVTQIVKGGRHLLGLINEILDISRIEAGTMALSPEPVDVADVVDETLTLLRPLADERGIRVERDPSLVAGVHVLADRQRLKQIVLNLVANAVKYNVDGGRVSVSSLAVTEGTLRITVADTGPGISADDIDKLFVPFQRLGAERTAVEGAGIGLALSMRLAEAMGGSLGVESTVGQGSRFFIQLPTAEDPVEQYERTSAGVDAAPVPPVESVRSPRKVLYIEDNLSNIRLIERILDRADVELIPAMQGRLGLDLAMQHQPAVILLDLHLPDVNGDEVLRELRRNPLTATTPVFMVSADATPGQIERLLAEGATGYLTKPVDVQELRAVLNEALTVRDVSV